ncbi:L-dopachrome tautomerase-related protein [Altericista sp. CCNU0014]|uniref:L-dopachrome tautomerase-related protein n=1 Tax=Altericista sp. CCNU0014 TaxID=3082949 RepID=UPI00384E4A57
MQQTSKQVLSLLSTLALTGVTSVLISVPSATGQSPPHSEQAAASPRIGQLELVADLDITPGNVTVSRTGRIFASVHGMRRGQAQLIEILPGKNKWKPFPNAAWNAAPGSGKNVLNTAHGVAIDARDRLWAIDHGNWMPNNQAPAQPKLFAFDISTGKLVFRMDFDKAAAPDNQILQDLAVDSKTGFVYLADSGDRAGILVVDTNNRKVWRWEGHPSLQAENIDMVVEGNKLSFRRPDGSLNPARIGVNPITLSADGETLFYGAMTGTKWYSLPAKLLRGRATNQQLAQAVKVVGNKPISDGVSTDAEGNHFITNLPEDAIDTLSKDGKLTRLVQDKRFLWADNVRFGADSWLYININQLHRASIFTGKPQDGGTPPYQIFRVWTGTKGQPGR